MFVVRRSEKGLWTTYEDCEKEGIVSPTKVMSDVRKRPAVKMHFRKVSGNILEFCV